MLSKARQKEIMEKIDRAQKFSILGPQNLGGWVPIPPESATVNHLKYIYIHIYLITMM